jgi:hypothetical protein
MSTNSFLYNDHSYIESYFYRRHQPELSFLRDPGGLTL